MACTVYRGYFVAVDLTTRENLSGGVRDDDETIIASENVNFTRVAHAHTMCIRKLCV